ncbi:MAG: hypothetical protein KDE31_13365, partial [Caldilineaceae bacterium]|nr:hypothetical protein [Caldilineaceae bacterium]
MNPVLGITYDPYTATSNGEVSLDLIDHNYFGQDLFNCIYRYSPMGGYWSDCAQPPIVSVLNLSQSILRGLGHYGSSLPLRIDYSPNFSLFDAVDMDLRAAGEGNVFLKNYKLYETQSGYREYWVSKASPGYLFHEPSFLRTAFPTQHDGNTYVALAKPWGVDVPTYLDVAEQFANQLGGHVVTINDAAENQYLTSYRNTTFNEAAFLQTYPGMECGDGGQGPSYCWQLLFTGNPQIGLNDRQVEGQFRWVSDDPVAYTNWRSGQPDNGGCGYVCIGQDYVEMDPNGIWSDTDSISGPVILELAGGVDDTDLEAVRQQMIAEGPFNGFKNNAVLNVWWDPDISHWMRFFMTNGRDNVRFATNNWWGTTSNTVIDAAIQDYNDDFNLGVYRYL